MLPLYEDPHFTFRVVSDRIIPRFHLEGVAAGRHVSVFRIDPGTGGTVKDGVIEIQGDQRERLAAVLEGMGYKVKRVGG